MVRLAGAAGHGQSIPVAVGPRRGPPQGIPISLNQTSLRLLDVAAAYREAGGRLW